MRIIAVTNQKGGCGKTIVAVNMASALAAMGRKVLFIDLDPQAHGTTAFGVGLKSSSDSSCSIFEAALNNSLCNFSVLIQQKLKTLWFIGSQISLSTMEQRLTNMVNAVMALANALKSEELSGFDHIIIDTPPSLGFLTLNALHAADHIIVPVDVSIFSLNGVSQIEEMLTLAQTMGYKRPKVNYLITLFDGRSNFAKTFLQKAKAQFGPHLLETVIRVNVRLREAAHAGKTIFEHDASANGAKDFAGLVKELVPALRDEAVRIEYPAIKPVEGQILFRIYAPDAKSVYLVGSFNDWALNEAYSLKKLDNGTWLKILSLPEGSYQYKFVVDGKWIEDPSNTLTETNGLGGKNSLVLV